MAPAALADELVSGALAEPRNALPGPPFYGALEAPREIGWVRFGRLSITGWIAHQHHRIRRVTAMVDPLQEGALLYGQKRTDLHTEAAFASLVGVENSAFVGHVDLPADTCVPALLKVFAELDNGEKHLVYSQRFTPRVIAGAVTPLPALSFGAFLRGAWTLRGAAKRHGLPLGHWTTLKPALKAAWAAYTHEAPAARRPRPPRAAPAHRARFHASAARAGRHAQSQFRGRAVVHLRTGALPGEAAPHDRAGGDAARRTDV